MQISPAISSPWRTTSLGSRLVFLTRARAAARAYEPPEPMARIPSSGSMMSPVPEMMKPWELSATARRASRRRSTRSLR